MRKKALTDLLFWSLAPASGVVLAGLVLLVAGVVELKPDPAARRPDAFSTSGCFPLTVNGKPRELAPAESS